MPSTRRSQASVTGQAQGHSGLDVSTSPKITRSARVLASQDAVEQESKARGAKRRKTASSLPPGDTVDQDVGQSVADDAQESPNNVQQAASRDIDTNGGHDGAKILREGEYKRLVPGSDPEDSNETLADPERNLAAPSTTSLPVATSSEGNIATLDDLTDQILNVVIRTTPTELGSAIKNPASDRGKEYSQLHARFAAAKQQYTGTRAFISPSDLGGSSPVALCRRVNLATWVTSLFDGKVGLEVLDSYFLFTFLPRGGTLSKLAASLWIELKTQALIAAVVTEDIRPPTVLLSVLFDESVRWQLLDVRPGADELAPSEEDFIRGLRSRQRMLEVQMAENDPQALAQSYRWTDLLENAVAYIKILKLDDDKLTGSERLLLKPRPEVGQREAVKALSHRRARNGDALTTLTRPNGYLDTPEESFKHRLARCALLAVQAVGLPFFTHDDVPWPLISNSTHLQEDQPTVEEDIVRTPDKMPMDMHPADETSVPHDSQKAPTLVLYERARKAFEIEALHPARPGNNEDSKSERQKWTVEEERVFLESLDRVRGPDWAQILSDDQLKQRTQLELRDKAKSLKLFFLKAGIEVPYFLKEATKSGSTAPLKQGEEGLPSINAPAKAEGSI